MDEFEDSPGYSSKALLETWQDFEIIGQALLKQKRYRGALRAFERALVLEPGIAALWYAKGQTLEYLHRYPEV